MLGILYILKPLTFLFRKNFWNYLYNVTTIEEENFINNSISTKEENFELKFQEYIKSASCVMKIIAMELCNNIIEY